MKFTKTEEELEWDKRLLPRKKLIQYLGKFDWFTPKYSYQWYARHKSRIPKKRGFSRYLKRRQYDSGPGFFTGTFKQGIAPARPESGYVILHNRIS